MLPSATAPPSRCDGSMRPATSLVDGPATTSGGAVVAKKWASCPHCRATDLTVISGTPDNLLQPHTPYNPD